MAAHHCLVCAVECGPFNICDPCADGITAAECTAQGIPVHVDDDATIRRVAALIAPTPTEQRGAA